MIGCRQVFGMVMIGCWQGFGMGYDWKLAGFWHRLFDVGRGLAWVMIGHW